jgi:hypothetical protein
MRPTAQPFANAAGRPLTRGGLGRSACWISGGRTACSLVEHGGIEEIAWFGDQPLHRQALFRGGFRSAYARVFRAQLMVGDRLWTLGIGDGALHPSGWTGRMAIPVEGLELELAVVCSNNALIQAVRVLKNPRRHALGLRLSLRDYLRVQLERRTWSAWKSAGGAVVCTVTDVAPPHQDDGHGELNAGQLSFTYPDHADPRTTRIAVVGDGAVAMRSFRSQLRQFDLAPGRRTVLGMALVFASSAKALAAERRALAGGVGAAAGAAAGTWAAAERDATRPAGLSPEVVSFAQQVPALVHAAMPADLPGAMRASYNSYWVWGWDTLVHAHTYLLNGVDDLLAPALDLYVRTAHPDYGIGHAFDKRMRPLLTQPLTAQGLFAIAAWQLWSLRGDLDAARRHWPFIVRWLQRCRTRPVRDGLFVGMALIPDFPQDAGQDGDDLSPFNNSVMYQACRCIEGLAGALGDAATAASAGEVTTAMRAGFARRLWDARRGFWNDSVRASSYQRRPSYPAHALIWVTPFCRELINDPETAAAFAERHLRMAGGIRPYPAWDPAFNADGNQLAQHYAPGQDPLFLRLMAMTGRQARLREWLRWKDQLWGDLTVPEGVTVEAENDGPVRPDLPGGRQMFAVKAWSDGLFGAVLGIAVDPGGLTAEPGLDGPLSWSGIPIRGRRWSVQVTGAGAHVARMRVAGTVWHGTRKVPLPARGAATVVIERSAQAPSHPVLHSADGASVLASRVGKDGLEVRLAAPGRTLVRLWAPKRPQVLVDGIATTITWDRANRIAELWLPACPHGCLVAAG